MSIFINIPGIVGSGGDSLHQGWIVIDSAALNIIKDVSYESHSTAAPTIEKPTNSVVSITKRMCSASAQLKQLSTEKNPFNWEMDLTQSAQGLVSAFNSVYAHYEFEKSYITEYSMSTDGDGMAVENISICYSSYKLKTYSLSEDGAHSSAGYCFINHTKQ